MRKITYEGKVPKGYYDSGIQTATIYVENGFEIEARKIASFDARTAQDFRFRRVLIDEPFSGKVPSLAMVYTGYSLHWDSYFRKNYNKIEGYCAG